MERLQAAIIKAREKQKGSQGSAARAPGQAETELVNPPLWDEIPHAELQDRLLRRNRIVSMNSDPEATPFDMLRTRTLRAMQEHGWRRLAITSPTPACGKSTISLNLAFSIARQTNTRAIAMEIDMRNPSQNRLLGLSRKENNKGSVGDVLSGRARFGDLAFRGTDDLAFLTNSAPVRNASDILLGDGIGQVLAGIEADYEPNTVIFDMPPVLVNDDTMAFMQHVDCVLIVAAAGRSTIAEIDRCERELASQTNVLGVVLNKCEFAEGGYGGYGYGY
ncbi:CpsD/CapB family tyrosine-protein kinase [Phycobacter sp. K97]|uniref:CpsD/CapB family tyrosine-protein kinase n=1 Tax=Phycobacter sedimenti TaxID=3133977 RepID=UPI00311DB44C